MFDFESLPNEMQLEILKKTEFRTIQSMTRVSKRVQTFIKTYRKYMVPIPIRQMLVTPEKISFTLEHSNEVCSLPPGLVDSFLSGAKVGLLWLETIGAEIEPISLLKPTVSSFSQVHILKLGSSKIECNTSKLIRMMDSVKCHELIIDWRFRIPPDFFEEIEIGNLSSLTIGEQESRYFYNPLRGEIFSEFQGFWLEIGPNNRLTSADFSNLLKTWKSGSIAFIAQYNIVLNLPILELFQILKNETTQETVGKWKVNRSFDDGLLEVSFFQTTNFSRFPSIVMRQLC